MSTPHTRKSRTALVGWLIALSAVGYLLTLATSASSLIPALPAWAAVIFGWSMIGRSAKQQSAILLILGLFLIIWAQLTGTPPAWQKSLIRNLPLLTMFVAVSFLALSSPPERRESLPRGRKGIWSTLLTCHLLGAVINLSIVFVVGDRLSNSQRLSSSQLQVIMRSFCAAAFWSPFFIAIGVALTYAPGARWQQLVLPGLMMTLPMFGLTFRDAWRGDGNNFSGYPLTRESLVMPLFLAIMVLIGHQLLPTMKILTLISLLAPGGALLFMRERPRGPAIRHFINQRLANISSQFALFLAAGVFSTGIGSLIASYPALMQFDLTGFTPLMFLLFSGVMILIALLGVHPVVSIALVSPFLLPLGTNPNQLAFMFLIVWGVATGSSPLSGVGLAMISRYHASSQQILKAHRYYLLLMWLMAGLVNILWFGK